MKIDKIDSSNYPGLIKIWEASVRATHDFLNEDDITFLKPLILEKYFDAVDLRCAKDDAGIILGFIGMADKNIEMLFISPDHMGKGIGAFLTNNAIQKQGATKVDVNEQNPQAIGFYEHLGFKVISRSATDGQGKPFPILRMEL